MFEANVAIISLLSWCFENTSFKASSTFDSDIEKPSSNTLVLSLISRVTPSFDISLILVKSVTGPIGVRSNLKSPVSTTVPFGVFTHIPCESGTEWVVLKNDISKFLYFNLSLLLYGLSPL